MPRRPPENRVRVANYGSISDPDDPRLIPVKSVPGKVCKLHHLAAAAFTALVAAAYAETGIVLSAASGWRPHRWKSRAEYERYLVAYYGSVANGRRWVAFDSPHETGLAVDLSGGGLAPVSKTAEQQAETAIYAWLCDNAGRFGFTPYWPEPWHWEYNISRDLWRI